MRIIYLEQIEPLVTTENAIAAVKTCLIDYAAGDLQCPDPMQILFNETGELFGDCHVKAAYGSKYPFFVIKVASGFYHNHEKGLPVNNGMSLVMSSETGAPMAILDDHGWLTSQRTAAAGALAAGLKPVSKDATLGVIGTGHQAELQALAICAHLGLSSVLIFGRDQDKAKTLQALLSNKGLNVKLAASVKTLCHESAIVVTTTPATSAVIKADDIPESLHIVAVGTDSPGKSEICPNVFAKAHAIVTDDHQQCLGHGDFGNAVKSGQINENTDMALGELLALDTTHSAFLKEGISIVDLTGLGVQDLAMATLIMNEIMPLAK
jgi:ornithine cyclodeaminase